MMLCSRSAICFGQKVTQQARAMFRKCREAEDIGMMCTVSRLLDRRPDSIEQLNPTFTGYGIPSRAVPKRIHTAVAIPTDRRDARAHGFKKDNSKPLLCAWHDEDVGGAVEVRKLCLTHLTDKLHAVRETLFQN